jgi:hypothetical protein
MSDRRILLCAPALTADESSSALKVLRDLSLAGATKFLVTTGKFDTQKQARAFNIEASYPAETALLQTLARWADVCEWRDARFRDAHDLFCLQRILIQNEGFDIAVLLRNPRDFEARWDKLLQGLEGRLFLTDTTEDEANLLIDIANPRATDFLDRAVQFYLSGRAYALEHYDLDHSLKVAAKVVELESSFEHTARKDSVRLIEGSAFSAVGGSVSE